MSKFLLLGWFCFFFLSTTAGTRLIDHVGSTAVSASNTTDGLLMTTRDRATWLVNFHHHHHGRKIHSVGCIQQCVRRGREKLDGRHLGFFDCREIGWDLTADTTLWFVMYILPNINKGKLSETGLITASLDIILSRGGRGRKADDATVEKLLWCRHGRRSSDSEGEILFFFFFLCKRLLLHGYWIVHLILSRLYLYLSFFYDDPERKTIQVWNN